MRGPVFYYWMFQVQPPLLLTSFKNLSGIHKRIQVIVFGLVIGTYHFSFPSEFHTSEYPSTQISFTCSNSLIETREEGVKYVQS